MPAPAPASATRAIIAAATSLSILSFPQAFDSHGRSSERLAILKSVYTILIIQQKSPERIGHLEHFAIGPVSNLSLGLGANSCSRTGVEAQSYWAVLTQVVDFRAELQYTEKEVRMFGRRLALLAWRSEAI